MAGAFGPARPGRRPRGGQQKRGIYTIYTFYIFIFKIFMKEARKLSHADSAVTKLKLLWRSSLGEADRDYWREQLASARTRKELREELQERYGLELKQDVQLCRFCRWVEDEDLRAQAAEDARCDRAELELQGIAEQDLRNELLRRMKERALARGDFKLAAEAIKLDLKAERVALERERVAVQSRKVAVKERETGVAKRPGGLTPEVLDKIERELNLFGPYGLHGRKPKRRRRVASPGCASVPPPEEEIAV